MGKEEIREVAKVIAGKQFMRYRGGEGGYVERFEKALCAKIGVQHALTVNSGTSALIAAMVGLGIGPGDEVIVPAYTWVATALAPVAVGAVPIMADVDESLMLDPADLERKITRYTKAIIPVHMLNLVCDLDRIRAVARRHRIPICEDACQAVGLTYQRHRVGSVGEVGAFSFNQFKNITCGEGGAVLTSSERIYQRAMMYHDTGCWTRPQASEFKEPFYPGVNYRATEIMGAMLGVQLQRLDGILEGLRVRRALLAELLARSAAFRISPHNDPAHAVALSILFATVKEAKEFADRHKDLVGRPIDTGRHVYTNWEPLLNQTAFHPKMNPYRWAHRKITYSKDMCARSLDIMARTCHVRFAYNTPLPQIRRVAKALLG
jgi:dTDP-4-amino-4,6-dideoxygalactose transaminase